MVPESADNPRELLELTLAPHPQEAALLEDLPAGAQGLEATLDLLHRVRELGLREDRRRRCLHLLEVLRSAAQEEPLLHELHEPDRVAEGRAQPRAGASKKRFQPGRDLPAEEEV